MELEREKFTSALLFRSVWEPSCVPLLLLGSFLVFKLQDAVVVNLTAIQISFPKH